MTLTDTTRRKIVIMGGGIAGVSAMSHIFDRLRHPNVTLIEASGEHEYPPLWPLLAVGLVEPQATRRPMADFFPEGATWFRDSGAKIEHNERVVITSEGHQVPYEYLIACPDLVVGYGKIKGVDDAAKADQLCDISSYQAALAARDRLAQLTEGTILFAQPQGAQEDGQSLQLAFLVDDLLRRTRRRDKVKLVYLSASTQLLPLEKHNAALEEIAKRKGIELRFGVSLTKIDAETKQAEFGAINDKGKIEKDGESLAYDLLHIAPIKEPPDAIAKNRKIAVSRGDDKGFLQVAQDTLQQPDYPTIFGIGQALSLPTLYSDAAARQQARVAAHNCVAAIQGKGPGTFLRYDGYTALPFATSQGKVYLAEHNYQMNPPHSPWRPTGEHRFNWWALRHITPYRYWHTMQKNAA